MEELGLAHSLHSIHFTLIKEIIPKSSSVLLLFRQTSWMTVPEGRNLDAY
jgi:hypothetical protein